MTNKHEKQRFMKYNYTVYRHDKDIKSYYYTSMLNTEI